MMTSVPRLALVQCVLINVLLSQRLALGDDDALGSEHTARPNIVIILVDDLGYGDLNLKLPDDVPEFRHPVIETPNLAELASQSVVFRHHYAAAPVCSPSRAGLLTGRTPTRCNIDLYINDLRDNERRFLAGPELTIAEIAQSAGYATAVFGKWHLNGADWERRESWTGWTGSFPNQQGFAEGWGSKENPHFTRRLQVNTQKHPGDFFTVDGQPLGIMKGDYVLRGLGTQPYEPPSQFELFNLAKDPNTRIDLSAKELARFEAMREELLRMHASVAEDRKATLEFIESKGRQR